MLSAGVALRRSTSKQWTNSIRVVSSQRRSLLTLAIETSCDDTAVAVLEKKSPLDKWPVSYASDDWLTPQAKLLFNKKVTARNTGLGGIHPVEALESHQENLATLVSKAIQHLPEPSSSTLCTARTLNIGNATTKILPDFISVTRGPGMRSNLACGLDTAKGLATAWQIPLLGVHHMQAHALTPRLAHALQHQNPMTPARTDINSPPFPFLTLLLSGGHTLLLRSTGLTSHSTIATTRDVAVGDTLDKVGRLLLPEQFKSAMNDTAFARALSSYAFPSPSTYASYPVPAKRGDEVEKKPNQFGWSLQLPLANTKELAFSFSSVATYIEKLVAERNVACGRHISDEERKAFAQTALGVCFEHIASRTIIALEDLRREARATGGEEVKTLVVSGGVASNDFLRWFLRETLDVRGFTGVALEFPPVDLCTDNAAMIAWTGAEMFEGGWSSGLDIRAVRKWGMDQVLEVGGYAREGSWWLE